MPETIQPTTGPRPIVFSIGGVSWQPWLEPVQPDGHNELQHAALNLPFRGQSPYRRVLARDPGILHTRTLTDNDIFFNSKQGLPRAERELAAVAVSRFNGCVLCASVHARLAATYSKRQDDVQRLLDEGIDAPQDERWAAIQRFAKAVTETPFSVGPEHVEALKRQGLDDLDVADLLHASAYFNWANRLMLSLGEPVVATDRRSQA